VGALACGLVGLLLAGAGGKAMETTLQDDAMFLHRPAAQVRSAARTVAALGADRVRLTAGWYFIAPRGQARRMPRGGFDGSDSATYPVARWTELDTAVKAATDAGLKVQLDVGFWAPRWAVRRGSPAGRNRWWPDARRFADFATAVARRYSGAFRDPLQPRHVLPAVRMYTPWNEPNHRSFLEPQWVKDGRGGYRPESPHIYRAMYQAAYSAIKRVSPLNRVLLGNTSPEGSPDPSGHGVAPLEFLRTMACVDEHLAPLRVPECRRFRPLSADGYAHHPYARWTTPDTRSSNPDDVPLADTDKLEALLSALHREGRITTDPEIYFTEFGYESREDDPFVPFDRAQQAEFLSWADYLAWRDPRVRMFAQFQLRDIDPRESGRRRGTRSYYRDFQSGLYDVRGRAKPAARSFRLPFWVQGPAATGQQGVVLAWGQVRPNRGAETVRIERREGAAWVPAATYGRTCDGAEQGFLTDAHGTFERAVPAAPGPADYRFAWRRDDGSWDHSNPVTVAT
jgi:hypothetical protein